VKIAMLAPPWLEIPPRRYGGIEHVVALLTHQLVQMTHEVILFAAPGSHSIATVQPLLRKAHPNKIGHVLQEIDHVTQALDYVDSMPIGKEFDVLHDHTTAGVALARRFGVPMVHTMHNGHAGDRAGFYCLRSLDADLVAVSEAQRRTAPNGIRIAAVVPNPIDVDQWPFRTDKLGYALWVGRFDPAKGPDRAIAAARRAKFPLILAGPVQPGQATYFRNEIEPYLNGMIRYVGEIGGQRKADLFANATALLMPIRWNEPFGMVMVEALACGTPVIAFAEGAATEIVIDGTNGYLVNDEAGMADALEGIGSIAARECRDSCERYEPARVAHRYLDVFTAAIEKSKGNHGPIEELQHDRK